MDMPKGFYDMVCADIKRLDNVRNLSIEELRYNYIVRLMQGIKLASTSGVMVCGALQMMEHILLMDIWPRILKSMCYLI